MRLIVLAMLLACALAASSNRVRRNPFEKGDRKRPEPTKGPDHEGEDVNRPRLRRASPLQEQANRHQVERRSPPQKWESNPICYYFADGFNDDTMKTNLRKAMDLMETDSCVQFVEVGSGDPSCTADTEPKILVKNDAAGCWADVGCHPTTNRVNVATTCDPYDQIGVLVHELFHALGRFHEHNRPDRDQFVSVHLGNVKAGQESNFDKKAAGDFETYGLAYDYLSIMHYGETFFSKDGSSKTLEVKDTRFQGKVGLQKVLSTSDVMYLNMMYECYETDPVPCENHGARRDDGSCYCIFPFVGANCEDVDGSVHVVENDGSAPITIDSDNFPSEYPLNDKNQMLLKCTDTTKKAQLAISDFEVEGWGCYYDKFVFTITDADPNPLTVCEDALKDTTLTSLRNSMMISLQSDDYMSFKGFDSKFTCV